METISKAVLKDTVTTRRVPMTEEGMTNLRNIREFYRERIRAKLGKDVELPFPSVFDMVLRDFAKEHGINGDASSSASNAG